MNKSVSGRNGLDPALLRNQRDLCQLVRSHFDALVAEGFNEDQALMLTLGYQGALLAPEVVEQ